MFAFERAVRMGADMLELDVHLTKDKHVVVFHDANIGRVTGEPGKIATFDYKDLPKLSLELPPSQFDRDSKPVHAEKRESIPLLREVFDKFPDVWINIDIKPQKNVEMISKEVLKLIKEYKREHITVWGSMRSSTTTLLYNLAPEIPLIASSGRMFSLILAYFVGILPLIPIKESFIEPPLPHDDLRDEYLDIAHGMARPSVVNFVLSVVFYTMSRKTFYVHLKARGCRILFWVANSPSAFDKAFELGATGVMTDYPSRLKAFLKGRSELITQSRLSRSEE
jgi:glycerophosphoryl diester phosphodiesterase